jgi:hypothetical protein
MVCNSVAPAPPAASRAGGARTASARSARHAPARPTARARSTSRSPAAPRPRSDPSTVAPRRTGRAPRQPGERCAA